MRAGPDSLLGRMARMGPAKEERAKAPRTTNWHVQVCEDLGTLEAGVFYDERNCYVPNAWRKMCRTLRQGPSVEVPFGGPHGVYKNW